MAESRDERDILRSVVSSEELYMLHDMPVKLVEVVYTFQSVCVVVCYAVHVCTMCIDQTTRLCIALLTLAPFSLLYAPHVYTTSTLCMAFSHWVLLPPLSSLPSPP